ncbi:MAG: type IV secretion system protein [Aliishimia sp.]
MKRILLSAATALALCTTPALSQGVPTFDGQALRQLLLQLEHMAEDLGIQHEQLTTLRRELETQLMQLENLEAQLRSLINGNGLGDLFATIEEFEELRGALVGPLETLQALANGDFTSGSDLSAQVENALSGTGLTSTDLSGLSSSTEPADNRLATSAGASAMLSVAAQESHEEAGASLGRLETMVGLIDDQDGLKAAVDLNTRVTAELGIIMTQIWRLEAAQGVSAGQLGVVDAATLAAERKFRSMEVPQ